MNKYDPAEAVGYISGVIIALVIFVLPLVSNGLGVLLPVLWGYRPGARWLWWMLLLSGMPGFVAE